MLDRLPVAIVVGVATLSHALGYASEVPAGREHAEACTSCHEGDGRSAGLRLYPRIAGQHYDYLLQALKDYRNGRRKAGYAMQMVDAVKDLDDRALQELARYYSELPW
ncbi:MAG TPA: c-type cytochrome [Burkholderiales bacterium]|nr:c-type cytochrome [Burkholderiales bacterium]